MAAAAGRPEVRREKNWRKSSVAVPGTGFFGCALQRAGQCAVRGVGGTFDAVDGLDAPPRQGSLEALMAPGVVLATAHPGYPEDVRERWLGNLFHPPPVDEWEEADNQDGS